MSRLKRRCPQVSAALAGAMCITLAGATIADGAVIGTLELDINTATGDATLVSGGGGPAGYNNQMLVQAIQINSAGKNLIPANWKSLKSFYNLSGWLSTKATPNIATIDEFTNDVLPPGSLFNMTTPGSSLDYGDIFPQGFQTDGDVTFRYNYVTDAQGDLVSTTGVVGNVAFSAPLTPEPTTAGVLALATFGLLSRGRKKQA